MKYPYEPIDANEKVLNVVKHPAFHGFGRFLFPLEDEMPDPGMKLNDIGQLLYYHADIDVNITVKVINYMLNEVNVGKTIFYDIHSEQDKKNFPKTENTGLFFFRGKPGAPFAIVSPGGAFKYVGSIHESFPMALELSKRGYNAFALQYRTGGAAVACEDLAFALTFIFDNAKTLEISTEGYSLWVAPPEHGWQLIWVPTAQWPTAERNCQNPVQLSFNTLPTQIIQKMTHPPMQ